MVYLRPMVDARFREALNPPERLTAVSIAHLEAGRGRIDGQDATRSSLPGQLKLGRRRFDAAMKASTDIMKAHVRFAGTLGLKATPDT